jgi:hypothetical protein
MTSPAESALCREPTFLKTSKVCRAFNNNQHSTKQHNGSMSSHSHNERKKQTEIFE